LGARAHHAHRSAQKFRRHDEAALAALGTARHDREQYVSAARHHIQALEQTMLRDIQDRDELRDAGWDADSLRKEYGGE